VLRGDFAAAGRLERKWADWMMLNEEAGVGGAGARRRRRRAREAQLMHADEEEGGAGTAGGVGRRRRARSGPGGCVVM
jgi:F-box/leucine-rich repeat protein 2/20